MLSEIKDLNSLIADQRRITSNTHEYYRDLQSKAYHDDISDQIVIKSMYLGRKIIATAACRIIPLAAGANVFVTDHLIIATKDGYRNCGHASTLLSELINDLARSGKRVLFASKVAIDNPTSRKVFEKIGCKVSFVEEKQRSSGNYLQLTYSKMIN